MKVIVMTDGNTGDCIDITVERHNESVNAMKVLGLNQDDILFLGQRYGTLSSLLNQNQNYNNPYSVNGTTTNINYPFSYQKNATYCGANLAANLEQILSNFKPTIIIYPDCEDEQMDLWATNAFIDYAASQMNYTGTNYTYIVHNPPDQPSPRVYYPDYPLTPPPELTELDYKWVVFPLTPYEEGLKETAFNSYIYQINSESYLRSFIRTNELFAVNNPTNINVSNVKP